LEDLFFFLFLFSWEDDDIFAGKGGIKLKKDASYGMLIAVYIYV
jgi:hypothetical protein